MTLILNGRKPEPTIPNLTLEETREQIRSNRARARLLREQLECKRLERAARLQESYWNEPYVEMFARLRQREQQYRGPATLHDRRFGKDFPIYQTEQELGYIRASSRILCATNSYAIGLLEGLTNYVVATGFKYNMTARNMADQKLADAAQIVVDAFLERNAWSGGELPSLEEERFQASCVDGEDLLIHTKNSDGTLDVRTADSEQMRQPPGESFEEWGFGVRADPKDVQKPLAYWLQWSERPEDGQEYRPDEIVHLRRNVRRSMKRGLPDFAFDAADSLRLAGRLNENLGEAGAEQAAIVGVRQHAGATQAQVEEFASNVAGGRQTIDPATEQVRAAPRYRRGRWEDIPDGMNYVAGPIAQNSPIHLELLQGLCRSAAVRWNAPEWLASADASNNNYASSLTAESPFVRTVLRRQATYKAAFKITIWYALRHWCETHGGLQVDGVLIPWGIVERALDMQIEAVGPETRNKLEEAQTLAIERTAGVTSVQTWQAQVGRDPEIEQQNIDEWREQNPDIGGAPMGVPPGLGTSIVQPNVPQPPVIGESITREDVVAAIRSELLESRSHSPIIVPQQTPAPVQTNVNLDNMLVQIPERIVESLREVLSQRQQLPAELLESIAASRSVPPELIEAIRDGQRVSEDALAVIREAIGTQPAINVNVSPTPITVNNVNNVDVPPADITVTLERKPSRVNIDTDAQGNVTGARIIPQ